MIYTLITLGTIAVLLSIPAGKKITKHYLYLWQLKWAIHRANTLSRNSFPKVQYYVLKYKGKIRVCNMQQLRNMRKKGILNKNFNFLELDKIAIYKTKVNS